MICLIVIALISYWKCNSSTGVFPYFSSANQPLVNQLAEHWQQLGENHLLFIFDNNLIFKQYHNFNQKQSFMKTVSCLIHRDCFNYLNVSMKRWHYTFRVFGKMGPSFSFQSDWRGSEMKVNKTFSIKPITHEHLFRYPRVAYCSVLLSVKVSCMLVFLYAFN